MREGKTKFLCISFHCFSTEYGFLTTLLILAISCLSKRLLFNKQKKLGQVCLKKDVRTNFGPLITVLPRPPAGSFTLARRAGELPELAPRAEESVALGRKTDLRHHDVSDDSTVTALATAKFLASVRRNTALSACLVLAISCLSKSKDFPMPFHGRWLHFNLKLPCRAVSVLVAEGATAMATLPGNGSRTLSPRLRLSVLPDPA